TINVGRIDFVNSDPVYYGIENGLVETDVNLINGFPTALNSMLANGDIDIAPISSIEYARSEDYRILPNLSVSSKAEVGSIFLFSKLPFEELDGAKVAVSSTSATSVALLKILAELEYGVSLEYVTMDPEIDEMLSDADAALVIGDHALLAERDNDDPSLHIYDLGREWRDFSGERMVYAVWGVRKEAPTEDVQEAARALEESKRLGYENLDVIADKLADRMDIHQGYALRYLKMLDHDFTPEHERGLMKYYESAKRIGAIDSVPELRTVEINE
ncbi:MAG: menaquinone biosynthesis protein, partial [Halobacteria archaeon]|nr:menaquinone biosynthesis protein [Halobacteria archaeon]